MSHNVIVGGLGVGRSWPARRRPVTLGDREAVLDLGAGVVTNLAAEVWLDGVAVQAGRPVPIRPGQRLTVGATTIAVAVEPLPAPVPIPGPFARPPRLSLPAAPDPIEEPAPPVAPPPPTPVGVVAVVAPVAMAAVMAVALGNPVFALFALLGPVVAVGGAAEQRRRRARDLRRAEVDHERARAQAEAARAVAAEQARHRAEHLVPDVAEVLRRAAVTSPRLWERHREPDRLVLRLGVRRGRLVTVDAGRGLVGIAGPSAAAAAVARSLLCQAAVHVGPSDLRFALPAGDEWGWGRALPHVDPDADPLVVVAGSVRALPSRCATVVVLDATGRRAGDVAVDGLEEAEASACAQALAVVEDPDLPAGSDLPVAIGLADVLPAIGVTTGGAPFAIDLARDGPHALVAGTTGAGKSELLRTLVAGLATGATPDQITFLLVDFKGGSAFDACARLPHTVGVITDLDGEQAARALRSLEAELRHRERVARDGGPAPPRLVVVVDEFATLRAQLPDFVDALVGVAQRGRSLGLHLVLATQRPAGVVSDQIRANTDLRVCLRVQDAADSTDVIGVPDAAALPRERPGRALVRVGGGPVQPVQVARASDLERLVEAQVAAWAGRPAPRRPWLEPLPDRVDAAPGAIGVVDDPEHQCRRPLTWTPSEGGLLVIGGRRSGATTTLRAVAAALVTAHAPAELHLYAVGDLTDLGDLPHVGACIRAGDVERQQRLVRWLHGELGRRRAGAQGPAVVTLLDGAGSFLATFGDAAGQAVVDSFVAVATDGPAVGLHVVAAVDREGGLPSALSAAFPRRWTHRAPPGRIVDSASGLVAQVAVPNVVSQWPAPACAPVPIEAFPTRVVQRARARFDERPWLLPIGLAEHDRRPTALPLWAGDHVLVAGPPRSGRTTALTAIARTATGMRVVALPARRSHIEGAELVAAHDLASLDPPALVLVDDAETIDDPALARLVDDAPDGVHVVAAGRTDALRGLYGHWTRAIRRSRTGLLLCPQPDLDGDLLGAMLPRRSPVPPAPGRGYLVADGTALLVQVAVPP